MSNLREESTPTSGRSNQSRGGYHRSSSRGGSSSKPKVPPYYAKQKFVPVPVSSSSENEGNKSQPTTPVPPSSSDSNVSSSSQQKQRLPKKHDKKPPTQSTKVEEKTKDNVLTLYIGRITKVLSNIYERQGSTLPPSEILNTANWIWYDCIEQALISELNPSIDFVYSLPSSERRKISSYISVEDLRVVAALMVTQKLIEDIHNMQHVHNFIPESIRKEYPSEFVGTTDGYIFILPKHKQLFSEIIQHEARNAWRKYNTESLTNISRDGLSKLETQLNNLQDLQQRSTLNEQMQSISNKQEQLKKNEQEVIQKLQKELNEIQTCMVNLQKCIAESRSEGNDDESSGYSDEEEEIEESAPEQPIVITAGMEREFIGKVDTLLKLVFSEETDSSEKLKLFSEAVNLLHSALFKPKEAEITPLRASGIPCKIVITLLDFLKDHPEKIPQSVINRLLEVTSISLKGRIGPEESLIIEKYHEVLDSFMKGTTIRKMEILMGLMNKITQSLQNVNPVFVQQLMKHNAPKPLQKNSLSVQVNFSDREKLVQLWQVQSFCASLVMTNPALSHHIFVFYERHVLSWLKLWEEVRSLCLRETSLGQLKRKKVATSVSPSTLSVSENEGYISSSESEQSRDSLVNITDKIQSQLIIDGEMENDLKVINEESVKTPEILKEEAEKFSVYQLSNDCQTLFENTLNPTDEERKAKVELVQEITSIIKTLFEKNQSMVTEPPKIFTYGSYASDLSLRGASDIDMCVSFDGLENIQENNKLQGRLLEMIRKEMDGRNKNDQSMQFPHLKSQNQEVVRSSRVPILKVHDSKRNLDCDLCVATYLGVVNTKMISTYIQSDQRMLNYYKEKNLISSISVSENRIKILLYIIKKWAKQRHINDPPGGSLSSYSYVLMTIQFLQTLDILPSLQAMLVDEKLSKQFVSEDIAKPHHVNAYNTKYFCNLEKLATLWKASDPEKAASYSVGKLLYLFFEFYAKRFNFDNQTISIKSGFPIQKKKISSSSQTIISIEDPFEGRDLGTVVSDEMGPTIVSEFRRAFEILSSGGSLDDILEQREGIKQVNIYQMKKDLDYEEHMDLTEVEEMLKKGELFRGEFRVNKKRFLQEAYVTVEGGVFNKDIFIEGMKNRNRAMHGDIVAIKIQKKKVVAGSVMGNSEKELEDSSSNNEISNNEEESGNHLVSGVVVAILKKKSPSVFPCTMMETDDIRGFRWMIPLSKEFPKLMVRLDEFESKFSAKSVTLEEAIFVVEMQPWGAKANFPRGKLVGCIGMKKDLWSLKRALLLQHCPKLFDNIFSQRKQDRDAEKEITTTSSSVALAQSTNMAHSVAGSIVSQSALDSDKITNRSDYTPNQITNIGDTISDIKLENQAKDELIEIQDWRDTKRIFTIDPTQSRDLDDAIAIEPIFENGLTNSTHPYRRPYEGAKKFLVTVAIADVSQFVPENSPIDKEARKRATSVYLINSVEHMLDPSLSQNLCSLHGGVNRFAIAVEFIIDRETGDVDMDSVKFNRCMMKSCCRLDYNRAQKMIVHYNNRKFSGFNQSESLVKFGLETGEVPATYGQFTLDEIYEDIQIFNELSQRLRKQRADNDSIFLTNEQLHFECDQDGRGFPMKVLVDEHNESHILIEEMMLVANQLAAMSLYKHFGDAAFLRIHSSPKIEKIAMTVGVLADRICKWKIQNANKPGIEIEAENDKSKILNLLTTFLNQSPELATKKDKSTVTIQFILNSLIEVTEGYPVLKNVVQHILLREMQLAKYAIVGDCGKASKKYENTWHFALGKEFYTHFTSPIRRYADLVVHRSLLQMLRENKMKGMKLSEETILSRREISLSNEELSNLAEHINDQAYRARLVQDDCEKQYLAYYLLPILSKNVERVEAIVLSLGKRGFTVFVPKYGIEVQVNAMKQFTPTPTTFEMSEVGMDTMVSREILNLQAESDEPCEEFSTGLIIDKLTITWASTETPINTDNKTDFSINLPAQEFSPLNRSIELSVLKVVMVDLDVNLESVPLDIVCYNVWEKDQDLKQTDFTKMINRHSKTVVMNNAQTKPSNNLSSSVVHQSVGAQGKKMEKILDTMQKNTKRKMYEERRMEESKSFEAFSGNRGGAGRGGRGGSASRGRGVRSGQQQ